jgi:hypothetical protein
MPDTPPVAEEFRSLYSGMSTPERWQVFLFVLGDLVRKSPHAVAELRRHLPPEVRALLAPTDKEYGDMTEALCQRWAEQQELVVTSIRRRDKKKRDRKSDPESVRRNIAICDLRDSDPKRWTLAMLARKYHISKRAIQLILGRAEHWRALGASN